MQHGNRSTVGGQFAPNGLGQRVEGGYRLSGSWNFGSGTGHSNFVVGGFIPMHGGEMQMGELGMPEMLVAVMPREQVNFTALGAANEAYRAVDPRLDRLLGDLSPYRRGRG